MKKRIWGILLMCALVLGLFSGAAYAEDYSSYDWYAQEEEHIHDWGDWEIEYAATINRTGSQVRECWECLETETRTTPKLTAYAKFSKKKYSVTVGKTLKLKVKYAAGDKVKKFKVSNKKILSITKSGKVKGLRTGTTKVTVYMKSGKKATCKVTVKAAKAKATNKAGGNAGAAAGNGIVYWVSGGEVYHSNPGCRSLARSRNIMSEPLSNCPKSRPCKNCYH